MKYRPFNTNFWDDGYIDSLTNNEKLVFILLFTSSRVTTCGIYELLDSKILSSIKITPEELSLVKAKFENDGRFYFHEGWVYIANFAEHNRFSTATNIINNFKKEFESIPEYVRKHFFAILPYRVPIVSTKQVSVTVSDIVIVIVSRVAPTLGPTLGSKAKREKDEEYLDPNDIPL